MADTKKIVSIAGLLYLVALFFFSWGVAAGNYKIFPWKHIEAVYKEFHAYLSFKDGPTKSTREKITLDHQEIPAHYKFTGFRVRDDNFNDSGYLLISRYSKIHSQVIVELFSIGDNKVLHRWIPPLSEIFVQTPKFTLDANKKTTYRAQHPLMLKDGSLVFSSGEGPLVRLDGCGDLKWVIERHFHHSIEVDHLGDIIVPIITGESSGSDIPLRNDGFAVVSLEGEIKAEFSVSDILLKNGYRGLIYGVGKFETDRIHLNDAQPILKDSGSATVGDIALSIRHLSTVFLVTPQSQKIKWLKTGPWLNQHDINQLDDGKYSIFGNDLIRQDNGNDIFAGKKISSVYVYDPETDSISRPYLEVMLQEKVATPTAGRARILANGDVYVEESDRSRLLRISENSVRWEYVNSISSDTVGALHWSRYISAEQIDLKWKESLTCN